MSKDITQEKLKDLVRYCPETGVFTNIRFNRPTGAVAKTGYLTSNINNYPRLLHRMAYLYMTGSIPGQVDHINHDRSDNRWCNLRPADQITNSRNMSMRSSNKSGVCGVHWDRTQSRWVAYIKVYWKRKHLYGGKDFFLAVCARKSAELRYGFHPNHGAVRGDIF